MVKKVGLSIYEVTHNAIVGSRLVVAKDVNDAIKKFNTFYTDSKVVRPQGIVAVKLRHTLEVIAEIN